MSTAPLIAVVEDEEAGGVDRDIAVFHAPGDGAVDHGLDREGSVEGVDSVAAAAGVEDEVVGAESRVEREEIRSLRGHKLFSRFYSRKQSHKDAKRARNYLRLGVLRECRLLGGGENVRKPLG